MCELDKKIKRDDKKDKKRRYMTLLTWSIDCSVICSLETLGKNVT